MTSLAPGTGPWATRTVRHTPAPDSSAATRTAESASLHRNAQVGPDPDTMPASAPAFTPARRVRRSPGRSDTAAACRSLPSSRASWLGSPEASASSTGSVDPSRGGSPSARSRSSSANTAGVDRPCRSKASTQWKVCLVSTGTSSSPRPVPSAVPPCRANGTSLPRVAATSASSSRPISSRHSAARPTSTAAASALPPAMPPATGMFFLMMTRILASSGSRPTWLASAVTARQARLLWSVGTLSAPSPVTSMPLSSAEATVTSSVRDSAWKTVANSW